MKLSVAVLAAVLALAASGCFLRGSDTPLAKATARGDIAAMKNLLDAGADPNLPGAYRITPLGMAARTGNIEAIDLLLARGADPNLGSGFNSWPPLMHALHKNQQKAALRLLATTRGPSRDLDRALVMAAGYGQAAMVKALLEHGADPHASVGGATALDRAAGGAFDIDWPEASCDEKTATVRELLAADPGLTLEGEEGAKARKFAERGDCPELAAMLRSDDTR